MNPLPFANHIFFRNLLRKSNDIVLMAKIFPQLSRPVSASEFCSPIRKSAAAKGGRDIIQRSRGIKGCLMALDKKNYWRSKSKRRCDMSSKKNLDVNDGKILQVH